MIRELFVTMALLCVYPSVAFSSTNNTCQNIFGDGWMLRDDVDVFREAERFISNLDESYVPFVCVGRDDQHSPARTVRGGAGPPWTLIIAIDDRYLREERMTLRGLMAHEIAHYAVRDGLACVGFWYSEEYDAYQKCESGVDRLAAHWTSNVDVANALRSVHTFAVRYFLPEESNPRAMPILEERIHMLEYSR